MNKDVELTLFIYHLIIALVWLVSSFEVTGNISMAITLTYIASVFLAEVIRYILKHNK